MNEKFCTNFLFKKKHNILHKFFFICWKIRGLFPWRKFWVSHLMGIDACQIRGVSFLCLQSKLNKIENLAMLWKTEEQILLRHINLKKIKFQVMVFFFIKILNRKWVWAVCLWQFGGFQHDILLMAINHYIHEIKSISEFMMGTMACLRA